jgi:hypothetical protein
VGTLLGIALVVLILACLLYAQFGAFTKRRHPRRKEDS